MQFFLNRLESPAGLRPLSTTCWIGVTIPFVLFFVANGHARYPWYLQFPLFWMLGTSLLGFIVLAFLGKAAKAYAEANVTEVRRRALLAPLAFGFFTSMLVISWRTGGLLAVIFAFAAIIAFFMAIHYARSTFLMAKKQGQVAANAAKHAASR
ncbi:hypothetical protein K8Q93_03480 [Candidatus Parcubacteria bacterium]|nr:hypothetical protein [Candidatus Parcubacteria bacterium]